MSSSRTHRTRPLACAALFVLLGTAATAQEVEEATARAYPIFHLGVFGNADLIALAASGQRPSFRNGGLDLFMTSQLSERWTGLVELLTETVGGQLTTDIERLQISYEPSELFRITAGRLHSPLIRWNLAHHHGLFLQTTIDKPAMTRSEDTPGLWPVHFVGVTVTGRFGNALGLSYAAGVGNGRGSTPDQVQINGDLNDHKALLLGVGIAPRALLGLDLSVTGYVDRIPRLTGVLDETNLMAAASYFSRGYELRGEWGYMNLEPVTGPGFESTGWYLLVSRSLPGNLENLRPYAIVEQLNVAEGLDYLSAVDDQSAWAAGLRYDLNPAVALKGDYRNQRIGGGSRDGLIRFQLAFSLN